jgi:hypothetical protein
LKPVTCPAKSDQSWVTGSPRAEAVVHVAVEVADEDGPVSVSWVPGDVLDHLGVVVGRDQRLAT